MKASRFWFAVPSNLAEMDAEEQIAWIAVLGSFHKERDGSAPMGRNELRRRTGWGGSRADRFLVEAREWADEAGRNRAEAGPIAGRNRAEAGPKPGRSVEVESQEAGQTGPVAGRSRAGTGPKPGRNRAEAGPVARDSSAPPPVSEAPKTRSEVDKNRDSLSPTSLSPATERESVPAREGAEQPRPASSAPEAAPVAPAGGSGRGEAVAGLAERLPERLVAALRAAGLATEAQVAAAPDRTLRFTPGIGEAGLATIRRAIPAAGTGTATGTDARREAALERAERAAGLLGLNRKKKQQEVADA